LLCYHVYGEIKITTIASRVSPSPRRRHCR